MANTVSQKDTTFTKIFVGGLPYHTTDQSLREFFDQFGDIEEAVVITDRQTGKSRGYGFVTMSDREAATRACKDPNPIIDGRKANVNLAYLGAKPRGIQTGAGEGALAFPFALKAGYPGYLQSQLGLPQLVYPSTLMSTQGVTVPASPHTAAPLSPSAGQYFDYAAAYASQFPSGYESMYPYSTAVSAAAAAGYVTPAYTYAVPQAIAPGHLAHYQPQQIQERMQ